MGLPECLLIAMLFMDVGAAAVKHGEPKKDTYNVWVSLIGAAIIIGLTYWGGFFS